MSVFDDIRYQRDALRTQGRKIAAILLHRTKIARGYSFLAEWQGEFYYLVNSYDLTSAIASVPSQSYAVELQSHIWGIPVYEDTVLVDKVLSGVFLWSYKLPYLIPNSHRQISTGSDTT
jgi:hypothetical protein